MTAPLTITIVQCRQRVGDLVANADAMLAARAAAMHADIVAFPELQLVGYPPEDLVLKPALIARAARELDRLAQATGDGGPAMLVGTIEEEGGLVYNIVAALDDGRVVARTRKHELPNYGTFDEKRVFAPGPLPQPIALRGVRLGVAICEDIWFPTVCGHLKAQGAEILFAPHGSPFEIDKDDRRIAQVAGLRVAETGLPLIFLNRVGGQDEIVFDGCSFVVNGDGALAHQLPDWEESARDTEWTKGADGWSCAGGKISPFDDHPADIYNAMIMGLRDYVDANGFPGVVLGLSGGIDSALSAAVAVDALGADRVWCVMLPSRFTGQASLDDARGCADLLGCRLDTIPITPARDAVTASLAPLFDGLAEDVTEENIQSRLRGLLLMALSNKFGHLLLATGNKSELAVGYSTLYGDMCGGYSPIKDCLKGMVYRLADWRNGCSPVIPQGVIDRPPSAELAPDQFDHDSLPPYPMLDRIIELYVEEDQPISNIVEATGLDEVMVRRVAGLVLRAEFKRRQGAPGPRITRKAFGRDRRYPITSGWHDSGIKR